MGGRKDDVMTRPKNRNRPLSAVIEEFEVDDPDLKNLLSKNSHDENDNDDDERGGGGGERGGGRGRGKGKSVNGINNDKNIRGKDNNSSSVGNVSVSERTSRTKNDKSLPSSSSLSSSLLSGRVHLSPTTEEGSSGTSVCSKDTKLSNVESKVKELIKTKPSSSSKLCGVKSPLSSSSSSSLSYLFSRSLEAIPPPPSSQLASASTRRSLEAVISPPSAAARRSLEAVISPPSASTRRSLEAVVSPPSAAARRSLEAVASPPSSSAAVIQRSLEAVASPPPSPLASALTRRSLEAVTSPPSSPLASLSRQRSLEAVTSPPPSTPSTPSSPLSPSSLSSSSTPTNSPTALKPAHFHLNFHHANCSTPATSAGVPPFSPASLPTSPLSPTSAMSLGSPCTPSSPSSPSSGGGTPSPSMTGGNAFKIPIVSVTVCDLGGEFRERTSSNASDASVNSENGGYSGYNNLNNNTSSSTGSSPRRPSLRSRRSALTPNNINTLLTPSPKLGRRGSFGRRSFGSDGTQDGDDDTMSTSEHMTRLRQMTERLSLSTRRPSTMQWRAQYIERPAFPEQRVRTRKNGSDVMDVDDDVEGVEEEENGGGREGGKWTVERTQRINTALDWIKNELLEMRAQDQNLARQLLSIRSDIHQLKLARSCEEHQEMLDDVQSELEELQEFADVLDLPTPTITDSPLKHLGVTRMNFSARRFSTC